MPNAVLELLTTETERRSGAQVKSRSSPRRARHCRAPRKPADGIYGGVKGQVGRSSRLKDGLTLQDGAGELEFHPEHTRSASRTVSTAHARPPDDGKHHKVRVKVSVEVKKDKSPLSL